jgi:hypothetical protein
VLKAAHQLGGVVDQDGEEVELADYKPAHTVSTNEFCQDVPGQQNCHGHLAPALTADKTVPAYIANKYSGSDDSHQFGKTLKLHEVRKKNGRGHETIAAIGLFRRGRLSWTDERPGRSGSGRSPPPPYSSPLSSKLCTIWVTSTSALRILPRQSSSR